MRSIKLHKLLDLVGIIPSLDVVDHEINNISFNSKEVHKGTLFLGMPGLNVDGGKYCIEAIENGAEAAIIGSCLLYTSPSPRDRYISRMPSSA